MQTGQTLLVNAGLSAAMAAHGSSLHMAPGERAPQAQVTTPLKLGERVLGVITLNNAEREQAFTQDDVRLLETLAASMSVALDNARLLAETRQRAQELGTLYTLGQALTSKIDLAELIATIGNQLIETFNADIAYVALLDEAAA